MKLAILGAGIQAHAIADDFIRFSGAETIGVADYSSEQLDSLLQWAHNPILEGKVLDVADEEAVRSWLEPYDAVISAVPYRFNAGLARAAIQSKTHFTDLGGNNTVVDEELSLDSEAKDAGIRIVPDLGLAPGMVALLGSDLLSEVDGRKELHLRVGGLPQVPSWPLNYRLFFSVGGLINEYVEPCRVIRAGKKVIVPGMSECESLHFPAPFGELEAFQTSGGTSTLIETFMGEVEELTYKTIRYPGHNEQIRLLNDLGFFDSNAIETRGGLMTPRLVAEALFEKNIGEKVDDVVLVRITVEGDQGGRRIRIVEQMVEYPDASRGLSAMARTTGYPAAIITAMLGRGEVKGAGAQPAELCIPVDKFRSELAKRGIQIDRVTEQV